MDAPTTAHVAPHGDAHGRRLALPRAAARQRHRFTPTRLMGLLSAALPALLVAGCGPAGQVRYPLEVHARAERRTEGVQTLPRWRGDGSYKVRPQVLLDERNVRSVMVQPGESRFGLLLQLNQSGRARLRLFAQGNTGDQRLTVVVDGRALEGWTARKALKTGTIRLSGPRAKILRLHEKLTNAHILANDKTDVRR